jgi:FixJ family two-component response regulator
MATDATVFIIDDDHGTRESLVSLIDLMELPSEAYESAEAMLNAYDGQRVGCALIDLRLPGISGLELLERLKERNSPLGMVMITAHGEVPAAVTAMKNGAVDFLQKPYSPDALKESVRRALEVGTNRARTAHVSQAAAALDKLTDSERRVLELTIEGMPNKDIATRLGISLRTVHIRRASLLEKLGAKNRAELVRLVIESKHAERAC